VSDSTGKLDAARDRDRWNVGSLDRSLALTAVRESSRIEAGCSSGGDRVDIRSRRFTVSSVNRKAVHEGVHPPPPPPPPPPPLARMANRECR